MEEEGAAAATPADTSFWVSLELGSALSSMSGLGAEGSSSWWKKEAGRTPLGPGSAGASQGDPPPPPGPWCIPEAANAPETRASQPHPKELPSREAGS